MPYRHTSNSSPQGRLVLVLEERLHPQTRLKLHSLLHTLSQHTEPTFVAGLARATFRAAVKASEGHLFYNAADSALSLPETISLMPWKEVWVVNNGQVWCTAKQHAA